MISHVMSDKKAQQILKELYTRCRKLNISFCFLTQSYFYVPKTVRINCTHYILFKIHNNREIQQIAIDHSADMTIKILLRFIETVLKNLRQNEANYDLYRQNAKISALSSGELKKYEYLDVEDLGYRPDPVQKAKIEYSPLDQVFNKGLEKDERQEGLLKRLKSFGDKTDNQLNKKKTTN